MATSTKETAIDSCPHTRSVLLLNLLTNRGEITATSRLQHPTMYEPYLAVNEIEPLAFISPKIVLE